MQELSEQLSVADGTAFIEKTNSFVRSNSEIIQPTIEAYHEWQQAYDFFNRALFGGELPHCLITLPRREGCYGYFRVDAFNSHEQGIRHEIAINPAHIERRDIREVLSTLVHEMCHLWRHDLGPVNRKGGKGSNGYHDIVWADAMSALGLEPSDTGLPGGNRTGTRMTHYIVPDGLFDRACNALLDNGFTISWTGHTPIDFGDGAEGPDASDPNKARVRKNAKDRKRFSCPNCKLNAWAKPSANLACGDCHTPMTLVLR
ncbi:MAG: SprT-like domain-containing protein [Geminicoccaceae bacterium]|nr:SprT-like domain-containing protein [Geminicoccaceae bacterium]